MLLNIPIVTDIIAIAHNRQLQTDLRLQQENRKRTHHEYAVGDNVYVYNHYKSSHKLRRVWLGPFPIVRVHTNNAVTVRRGLVEERMSLRRIKPS